MTTLYTLLSDEKEDWVCSSRSHSNGRLSALKHSVGICRPTGRREGHSCGATQSAPLPVAEKLPSRIEPRERLGGQPWSDHSSDHLEH